ncbi:hybrid sensor histidine kinase/response regulator [Ancylobacter sp. SL191]|uniref:hybrid sensor histidine kinase/response regulator n=1 Tax=Ancylobacter sp. SL191 TaxID=2995166 RepID=UPI002271F5DD|nr:hybrid sensor histidine kinase/response regulator [Ancylobacter sp. SL191]WAC29054.1 hybrid sensor histidine kinase/response regulator [Ancylobacter sp. SL191]
MDDLLREFLTETSESLDVADVELVKFETDPNNRDILNNIFRLVHTIKGTCGFIGLVRLAGLAHAAETLMDEFRNGRPVTTGAVGLILRTVDRIKAILMEIERNDGTEPVGSDADLIDELEAEVARTDVTADAPPPPPPVADKPLIVQERETLPGEVPLDELERMFRETEVEAKAPVAKAKPAAAAAPAPVPVPVAAKPMVTDGAPPPAANDANSVANQTIRVSVSVLEHLMTMVSELVLTRNQLMEISRRNEDNEYKSPLQRLSTVTGELQEAVMRTRMQPIGNAWQKLPRIVRDLAQDLGKQIELEQHGAETELDRQVLDQIKDPLTHMVRNSADHGLELPAARRAAGKPEKGTIRLSAYHEGGHVILEIADDGRGLDVERIKVKAVENGLCSEADAARMTDAQAFRYIFHAGFSTAAAVTSVSGRGVGMDVVRCNIELIGGTIDVRSKRGEGTTFTIKIPLTLAIVPALIVESTGERFALPQTSVVELVRVRSDSEHSLSFIKHAHVLRLRDRLLPIVDLGTVMNLSCHWGERPEGELIVVMQVGSHRFGVVVDSVSHTEEIVVKPLSTVLRGLSLVSGSTILGDGRVIMIIDPNGLAQLAASRADKATDSMGAQQKGDTDSASDTTSLLLCRAGPRGMKAVPLSLVTRLEELDAAQVEIVSERSVAQYRGTLIPIVYANDEVERKTSGKQPLLIFSEGQRTMGLVVDEIVDIVETEFNLKLSSGAPEIMGGAIINETATEVLDVAYFMQAAFGASFDIPPVRHAHERAGRLLLVDGNAFHRAMLEPVLKGNGYAVTACSSASEALEKLAGDLHFDAVVSEVDMPGVDGFRFAERVRRELLLEDLPIIAMASGRNPDSIERGRIAGFTDYVAKFDRTGLIAALREFAAHEDEEKAA